MEALNNLNAMIDIKDKIKDEFSTLKIKQEKKSRDEAMNKEMGAISYVKSLINPSPFKRDKNDRSRFLGEGVSYKAKLIGILEVSEARGDRMCQEALADLKMAIRAAGEHKQRININIAIDGLRLRDEKTGDCLYHHPVHKISFIAQDMTDSRAFGYIFGSPDTGHRFFGIKTDKAASQVVISMRDLFQVVFELKKKEIEMAKQHMEQHQMKYSFPLETHLSASNTANGVSTTKNSEEGSVKRSESPRDSSFDVFTDLDPLGTGRSRPYVDKKDFFQDLKNPPKKLLKDLVTESPLDKSSLSKPVSPSPELASKLENEPDSNTPSKSSVTINLTDPFQEDPFDKDPFIEDFSNVTFKTYATDDPFEKFADFTSFESKKTAMNENSSKSPVSMAIKTEKEKHTPLKVSLPPEKLGTGDSSLSSPHQPRKFSKLQKHNSVSGGSIKLPSPKQKSRKIYSQVSVDAFGDSFSSPSQNINFDNVTPCDAPAPEPPPRNTMNAVCVKPPPLPPKKLISSTSSKPPPRPPHSDYDYIENYQTTTYSDFNSPPLPAPARKTKNNQKPSEPEYYLQPFPLLPPPKKKTLSSPKVSEEGGANVSPCPTKSLDITLSQLTKTGFSDLAASLNMSPTSLSKMTLQDLTKCLANISIDNQKKDDTVIQDRSKSSNFENSCDIEFPDVGDSDANFSAEFDAHFGHNISSSSGGEESLFDKYAVFRELVEQEQMQAQTSLEESGDTAVKNNQEEDVSLPFENGITSSGRETHSTNQATTSNNPSEDRYAALRDICIDDVILENDEAENSDKDDSVVEASHIDEDTDLIPSHPHSESTESPTIMMKEHQSVMETTIMEEDASALEGDDDVPDESIADVLQEDQELELPVKPEDVDTKEEVKLDEKKESIECTNIPVASNAGTCWAKFDNVENVVEKPPEVINEGHVSPWSADSKENDLSPTCREKKKYPRPRRQVFQEDDESEEHWDSRVEPRSWSPSWRENGWSDGDSLCDEVPSYVRDYHCSWRGRRRRVSPWNSREQSPWEEDDRELSEDQWDDCRWPEDTRQRLRYKGPSWEDERRRHYEEIRKSRKQIPWSSDIDRKSSRESLTWEEEERYPKRNYIDRRHRKWDDETSSRHRRWRDRDRADPGKKMSARYYRDRSHDHQWDDDYSEQGDDEVPHWPQRPRSCDRSRRQYSAHHSNDIEFNERRYPRNVNRDDYSGDIDYRRRAQTLQLQKSRRKHNQTSPFEDDFNTHFSYNKDMDFVGSCSDVFEGDHKSSLSSESRKKYSFADPLKQKEYSQFTSSVAQGAHTRDEEINMKSSGRCCQQSPFEDDFTPPETRRCSGRSVSSDMSDTKSGDDVFYSETKDSFKPRFESRKTRISGQTEQSSSSGWSANKSSSYSGHSHANSSRKKNVSNREQDESVEFPQYVNDKKINPPDYKSIVSSIKRSDSSNSLKKSESVNIFARNRDPFDDDFFCESTSKSCVMDKTKSSFVDSSKWDDAFNSFSFDEESK